MTTTASVTSTPQVGDVLVCSWGYDQTNVDFYKVLRVMAKSVAIVRIAAKVTESTGYMCGKSVPHEPHTIAAGRGRDSMTKRVSPCSTYGYSVKISDYATAFKWDGEPEYTSWYA